MHILKVDKFSQKRLDRFFIGTGNTNRLKKICLRLKWLIAKEKEKSGYRTNVRERMFYESNESMSQ